jgi:hypothetical protein
MNEKPKNYYQIVLVVVVVVAVVGGGCCCDGVLVLGAFTISACTLKLMNEHFIFRFERTVQKAYG